MMGVPVRRQTWGPWLSFSASGMVFGAEHGGLARMGCSGQPVAVPLQACFHEE